MHGPPVSDSAAQHPQQVARGVRVIGRDIRNKESIQMNEPSGVGPDEDVPIAGACRTDLADKRVWPRVQERTLVFTNDELVLHQVLAIYDRSERQQSANSCVQCLSPFLLVHMHLGHEPNILDKPLLSLQSLLEYH